ncbi:hypothetical protein [Vibrio sp. 10N.239.312.D08]|uniref:hypothetical protein n=1 Tax=Vibrio sp. 10N.239.312.D08 TaxID=3229978 RepID=UPI00354C769C
MENVLHFDFVNRQYHSNASFNTYGDDEAFEIRIDNQIYPVTLDEFYYGLSNLDDLVGYHTPIKLIGNTEDDHLIFSFVRPADKSDEPTYGINVDGMPADHDDIPEQVSNSMQNRGITNRDGELYRGFDTSAKALYAALELQTELDEEYGAGSYTVTTDYLTI